MILFKIKILLKKFKERTLFFYINLSKRRLTSLVKGKRPSWFRKKIAVPAPPASSSDGRPVGKFDYFLGNETLIIIIFFCCIYEYDDLYI